MSDPTEAGAAGAAYDAEVVTEDNVNTDVDEKESARVALTHRLAVAEDAVTRITAKADQERAQLDEKVACATAERDQLAERLAAVDQEDLPVAWTNSKIFMASTFEGIFEGTAIDLDTDAFKVALYNNTTAPDQTVVLASTAYNVGQWVVANEVSDGTNWDAAGEPLTGVTSAFTTNVYKWDATDTPQSGASTTLANVYGCLVYDTTTSSYGVSYHYFGGVQSVTGGTFTVVWHASGIFSVTA